MERSRAEQSGIIYALGEHNSFGREKKKRRGEERRGEGRSFYSDQRHRTSRCIYMNMYK